jgi:hypothetical protein
MPDEITDTDMNPSDPHGVGDSTNRSGEDVIKQEGTEPGRQPNQGTKGESERPYGSSDVRDSTSVAPEQSEAKEGTSMPAGDQGG